MRKYVAVVLLALGLSLGSATPAGAIPPNTWQDAAYGSCHVRVAGGNYGGGSYAVMGEYSGSVCGAITAIRFRYTTGLDADYTNWCANWMRFSNPYPGECTFVNLETDVINTGGSIIWLEVRLQAGFDGPSTTYSYTIS